MPNIATALKQEISRLARKELKSDTDALRKAVASYRNQISTLKRRVDTLERQVNRSAKSRPIEVAETDDDEAPALRFRPDGLAKHRKRLGLSAADAGKLMGVSALSVYKWESGKTRPRAKQLQAIAQLRTLGKREAAQRLEQLGSSR